MTFAVQNPHSQAAISSAEYMRHIRRNYFLVSGRVKIESDEAVSLYTREGLKVVSLTCSREQVEKFKKFEEMPVGPFLVYRTYDEIEGREYYSPIIK